MFDDSSSILFLVNAKYVLITPLEGLPAGEGRPPNKEQKTKKK
jgi:hypothetical protein